MTVKELEAAILPKLDKLYRVASRMASSSADAEDLVSATLLTGFQHCQQCDGRFPLAWMIQILRNKFLHSLRKQKLDSLEEEHCEHISDPGAHQRVMSAVHQIDILAALDKLPDEYRLAVALCDMEELDYAEAADALGVPIGTIRSRLNRGRKMLQQHLASWKEI